MIFFAWRRFFFGVNGTNYCRNRSGWIDENVCLQLSKSDNTEGIVLCGAKLCITALRVERCATHQQTNTNRHPTSNTQRNRITKRRSSGKYHSKRVAREKISREMEYGVYSKSSVRLNHLLLPVCLAACCNGSCVHRYFLAGILMYSF